MDRAFAWPRARAVALIINSPGGSAVQSHLIFQRVRQLSTEKKVPVVAFVEDVAASGGYMIACAADEIFADPSSILGSIGVIGATFGFDKLIDKIGIERRIYTSGVNKAMLDPFLPENPDHVARLKAIQEEIHGAFISLVKSRRGGKLNGAEEDLFTGEYWAAQKGRDLGLSTASATCAPPCANATATRSRRRWSAQDKPVRPHDAWDQRPFRCAA